MKLASALIAATVVGGLLGGEAHRKTERGNRLYTQGDWSGAMGAYADAQGAAPQAPELHYDVGNVLYRQEDWAGAAEAYGRALASASSELSGRAAYNLGNAFFKGSKYGEAVQAYRRALHVAPGDADAKRNLELALRALQKEKEKEREGEPEQQPDQEPKEDQEKKDEPKKDDANQGEKKNEKQPGDPKPQPGSISPEQARQLLERLSDQERENIKREAMRRVEAVPSRAPEKDW